MIRILPESALLERTSPGAAFVRRSQPFTEKKNNTAGKDTVSLTEQMRRDVCRMACNIRATATISLGRHRARAVRTATGWLPADRRSHIEAENRHVFGNTYSFRSKTATPGSDEEGIKKRKRYPARLISLSSGKMKDEETRF
ncbi:hypothetical protein MRX96_028762 [Rhipicephalus microplus]